MKIKPPRLIAFFLILLICMLFYTSCKYDYHTLEDTSTPIAFQTTEDQLLGLINTEEDTLSIAETSKSSQLDETTLCETTSQNSIQSYVSPIINAFPENMSVNDIYNKLLTDDTWVITTKGGLQCVRINLWDEFLNEVDSGKPSIVRIASYHTFEDVSPEMQHYHNQEDYPTITLDELYYDGTTFTLTTVYVYPDTRKVATFNLPYLLFTKPNIYYLGEFQDCLPPGSSLHSNGYSVYVFIDRSR